MNRLHLESGGPVLFFYNRSWSARLFFRAGMVDELRYEVGIGWPLVVGDAGEGFGAKQGAISFGLHAPRCVDAVHHAPAAVNLHFLVTLAGLRIAHREYLLHRQVTVG